MNIYFNASLAGKEKYLKEFREIISIIEDLGHMVYSDHVMKRDAENINRQIRKYHELDFRRARNEIQKSDAMVVEATYPSIGVGHTMTIALEMHKSVFVLYQNEPHGLLVGDPNRLLFLKKYKPEDNQELKNIIKGFLERVNKRVLKKRFNLMIDEMEEEYLEWKSKKRKISKADCIRQLIDDNLRKDKDYDNF